MENKTKPSRTYLSGVRTALPLAIVFLAAVVATQPARAQTFSVLHTFTGEPDGALPTSLVLDDDGNLYGTTQNGGASGSCLGYGCGVVFKLDQTGQETVLYSFNFPFSEGDGAHPLGALVLDPSGNLYGTTFLGGSGGSGSSAACHDAPDPTFRTGCGTVFKLHASQERVLYSFTDVPDGNVVLAGLVRDRAGNLYGTTMFGGDTSNNCYPNGCGIIFKLDRVGNETVLYRFTGINGDGANPAAALVLDDDGNLYGTTYYGGGGTCNNGNFVFGVGIGCGTVFKIDKSGNETVLYRFTGINGDGANPYAALVPGPNGELYGTTYYGGSGACHDHFGIGCGTVFKIDKSGNETVLYRFTRIRGDGTNPYGALVAGANGDLYGTTDNGGGSCNCGTVFQLDKTGKETVLYRFTGGADGTNPHGSLVLGPNGDIYGFTFAGGTSDFGTVFKLTQAGPLP